jgi:Chaperone of endosialidase
MKTAMPQFLIAFLIVCLASVQNAQAVVPPPDGGYPNFNTAEGQNALFSLTTGQWNTALGAFTLSKNTDGSYNTAVGTAALLFNIGNQSAGEGIENTAVGAAALLLNTTGFENTAIGVDALLNNTIGSSNTATGAFALNNNIFGNTNTATGAFALSNNTEGGANTATGANALSNNTGGDQNTATGYAALANNTAGDDNTANGVSALAHNTIGGLNTAVGFFTLSSNTTGAGNTAVGYQALLGSSTGSGNTAVGYDALVGHNGNENTALGDFAGAGQSTGDNNIDIGANVFGVEGESNTIRIGNTDITDTFITGISGTTVASGAAVLVDSNGHLGTVTSSKRFKEEIRPMNKTSEAIFSLEPVTFRYRKEIDPVGTSQFGLIAEEVAKVNPTLVLPDKEGKPYSVRYEAVNAMLLNEFLKEHRSVQELKTTVVQQQKQIDALTAALQKLSAKVELDKSAPQVAESN